MTRSGRRYTLTQDDHTALTGRPGTSSHTAPRRTTGTVHESTTTTPVKQILTIKRMACGRCAAERFSVPPRHVYRQSCTLGLFYLACFISRFVWRLVRFASAPPRHSAQPGLGSTLGAWRADRQVAWDGEGPASVPWVCLAVEALERSGVSSATVCTCTRVPRAWPWVTSPHGFCVGELHRVRLRPQRLFQLKKLLPSSLVVGCVHIGGLADATAEHAGHVFSMHVHDTSRRVRAIVQQKDDRMRNIRRACNTPKQ